MQAAFFPDEPWAARPGAPVRLSGPSLAEGMCDLMATATATEAPRRDDDPDDSPGG